MSGRTVIPSRRLAYRYIIFILSLASELVCATPMCDVAHYLASVRIHQLKAVLPTDTVIRDERVRSQNSRLLVTSHLPPLSFIMGFALGCEASYRCMQL